MTTDTPSAEGTETMKCLVSGCTLQIPLGKGCACTHHAQEAVVLIPQFGSGIPGDDDTEHDYD
ncbi:MAG: hypothetical protein V4606_00380 [Patescibacteria group bacterium]